MSMHRQYFIGTGESNTRYSTQLVTMQSYLKEHGFPFLFFNSCWRAKPKLSQNASVFKLVDNDRFVGFNDRLGTMCNYLTFKKKLDMKTRGHPTEKICAIQSKSDISLGLNPSVVLIKVSESSP